MKTKEAPLNLSDEILAEAYHILTDSYRKRMPEKFLADEMRSIIKDNSSLCVSIWNYKKCLDFLDKQ